MSNFSHLQNAFALAVTGTDHPRLALVRGSSRRFAVYRNNVAMGLFSALSSRYPVVKRLVGDEFFREMSRQYVAAEPPRSPIILYYGETFPAFIDSFEPARPIPYLAAVAEIEMARGLAYHAADIEPLGAESFAALTPDRLADMRVTLHPSISIVSSRFPIYSIWKVNQSRAPVVPVAPWAAEAALIARPFYAVDVHKLACGEDAFLNALAQGETIAQAVEAGQSAATEFDVAASLALLISAGVVASVGRTAKVVRFSALAH